MSESCQDFGFDACTDPRRGYAGPVARCVKFPRQLLVGGGAVPDGFRWCLQYGPTEFWFDSYRGPMRASVCFHLRPFVGSRT